LQTTSKKARPKRPEEVEHENHTLFTRIQIYCPEQTDKLTELIYKIDPCDMQTNESKVDEFIMVESFWEGVNFIR
jgi:hypothetical protein